VLNLLQDEKEIINQLQKGNVHAFEMLYLIYSPRLYGRLLKLVKSDIHAQEILQDVFVKIWEQRGNLNPEKSFRSFLYKIAENKAHDFFRKTARDKSLETQLIRQSTSNYSVIEKYKSNEDDLSTLQKAIEDLPPQRKQVFRLCKLEGKSYKEVSELLDISVSTISDHIVKGTKSVREYFSKHTPALVIFSLVISMIF
jgi:RNA polymerase sigma-70 factor (ECF subfamily)